MEQAGNQAPVRLEALTRDLNTVRANEVKAQSQLPALDEAITRGEQVVPPAVQQIEQEAAKRRADLAVRSQRYTKIPRSTWTAS